MNEFELKNLWQTANDKLDESHLLNKKNTEDITRIKLYNVLGAMKPVKIFTILIGFLWVGIGATVLSGIYTYAFSEANKFFLFAATAQILLTAIALFIYIFQLTKIYQVEVDEPILQTQSKLVQLKISTLWATRILLLQLPLWTIFWWNETLLTDWSFYQWLITLSFTVSFTFLAIWLFFNIKYENRNKKWFKLIFNGREWTPLMKSMELLEEIDEYKNDANTST